MSGPGRAILPMDDSIFFKLVRVVNLTARPFVESIGRMHRLSLNEWRVMLVLASHPGAVAQEVVSHTGLDKMTVSRALAGLARNGRLLRKLDAADKRRTCLCLSAAGQRVYEKIGVSGKARETQLFSAVGSAEQTRLGRTLDTLIETLLTVDAASD
ncbi:MAG: MarR family winged helix-turn-helix transcriptional regulator [Caldimonas sp.]